MGAVPVFFCLALWCGVPAEAGDEPFTGPANWGGTGLLETPTARVMPEGRFRVGFSQVDPYRRYYGAVSPLKGLELDGKVTEFLGVTANPDSVAEWEGYGNDKDKSFDLKHQFLAEGKYRPAVALGIMDPHGTRKFPSQYLVMSKQIYPFDFTIGFGNGRYGKNPLPAQGEGFRVEILSDPRSWLEDSQFFGGIEFAPYERFSFILEYSPIRYEKQTGDSAQAKYFQKPVPSKWNIGLRWKPVDWAELDVSWQRGEQFGVNLSTSFDLGKPLVPIYDHPWREKPEYRSDPLAERLIRALYASGFRDIGIEASGDELRVEAANDRYFYTPAAVEVALRVLAQIVPPEFTTLRLTLTDRGIPLVALTALREDVCLFHQEKLTANQLYALSDGLKTDINETLAAEKHYRRYFDYGLKPEFQTFLNDPSGFFKYRAGVSGWLSLTPWRGGSFIAGLQGFPLNTVSSSNEPLSKPVRTDNVPYMEKNVSLSMLMAEQIRKFDGEIYGRLSAGMLEVQYGGIDGEIARPFFGGRLMLGLSGSVVKKRDEDDPLKFKEDDWKDTYTTAFVNARLNIPRLESAIDIKYGRFLAGDRGTRITLSRFFNGLELSAWYSWTDTDGFSDSHNRGYHDKGIAVTIPLRLFKGSDSRTVYKYSLSPWTRDVAQDIDHHTSLFDFIGRNTGIYLDKDWKN